MKWHRFRATYRVLLRHSNSISKTSTSFLTRRRVLHSKDIKHDTKKAIVKRKTKKT